MLTAQTTVAAHHMDLAVATRDTAETRVKLMSVAAGMESATSKHCHASVMPDTLVLGALPTSVLRTV